MKNYGFLPLVTFVTFLAQPCLAQTPLETVNARMEAHNNHDLKAFLETYSADIQVYDYPDMPLGNKGKAHIEKIFAPLFEAKAVKTKIHYQAEVGDYVVNHETVVREGNQTEYVSIYEVKDGLITSVRFIK
ncbi:MAG TPA: nuclear transport factor 2 family protein [Gammaproteobacteria bacterium]|jgi:hypothetical protein